MASNDNEGADASTEPGTFEGMPLPEYLKITRLSNNGIKISLDLGVATKEGQRRLEEIIALKTIHSKIPLMEIDGPKYLDWACFSDHLVRLLLKRNVKVIAVPVHQVDKLQGRLSGLVMNTFRTLLPDSGLTMAGVGGVQIRDVITASVLTSRIIALQRESPDIANVKPTLMQMRDKNHVPKSLRPIIVSVYKIAKRNERTERAMWRKRALEEKRARTREYDRNSGTSASSISDCSVSDTESTGFDIEDIRNEFEEGPLENPDLTREDSPRPGSSKYSLDPKYEACMGKCYICKLRSKAPKFPTPAIKHYQRLCPGCAEANWSKRHARTNLEGYIAVVTGGRIKIGYEIVLKLLRDGCKVITTTRFPLDATKRYAEEPDYNEWKDRLKIYPLELKDSKGIYKFVDYLKATLPYLSIIINNAAQTIRRPFDFYKHLLEYEETPSDQLPDNQRHLMATTWRLSYRDMTSESMVATSRPTSANLAIASSPDSKATIPSVSKRKSHDVATDDDDDDDDAGAGVAVDVKRRRIENLPGAEENTPEGWSQVVVARQDDNDFPVGCLDEHGQQVDLRASNSWRAVLEEVPISELLEVLMVNTIAPYILNKELKDLIKASPQERRFIVNVSAMEGQFHRASKTRYHPHTNMAKAALNMMTRTGALGYREEGIYMTSVDTGWVTDERPFSMAVAESKKGFIVPLDTVDGAARVYDPVVVGLTKDKEPHYAVFLKNYKPHPW